MSAVFAEYQEWESASAFKLLSEQRERYIEQSRLTRNGVVAEFPLGCPPHNPNSQSGGQPLSHTK